MLKKTIKDCFTGVDNETTDLMKILFFFGFITIILGFGYETYHSHVAKLAELSGSMTAFFVGMGGALRLKKDTEPKA